MTEIDTHAMNAAIASKLNADARKTAGLVTLFHALGLASLLVLTGAGVGAALIGYSFLVDAKPAADEVAAAIAKSIDGAKVKAVATGEVKVADGGEVSLAPGGTVKLAPGGTVRIDPNATVRADAKLSMPRLSERQLQPDAAPVSGASVNTSYVQFRSVPFSEGNVITGWKFATSEETSPRAQFCYYAQDVDAESGVNVNLGEDGRFTGKGNRMGLDVATAFRSCQWFNG